MKESFFRRWLNSVLDRRGRANAMARVAAVVAGLTACALALAPMLETTTPVHAGRFSPANAGSAPNGFNGAAYLPAQVQPVYADDGSRRIDTF
jgi:hypothetical protein